MTGRTLLVVAMFLIVSITEIAGPVAAIATERAQTREQIREQPILDRPYRVGHFYGNTVRRRHHRREG